MSTRSRHPGALTRQFLLFAGVVLLASAACLVVAPATGAETSPAQPQPQATTSSEELLRSYLQLQEQLHSLQLSVEKNREDNAAAAEKSAEQVAARLNSIEQAVNTQRARELEAMQSSNRVMITVAGTFAGVGLLAMVCMAYFQWRTINRLAEISAALPATRLLGPGSAAWAAQTHLLPGGATDESNKRLMVNLQMLEKRLGELEHTAESASHEQAPAEPLPSGAAVEAPNNGNSGDSRPAVTIEETKIGLLLGKGQSLLNMDRAEEALAALDEALKASPNNAEVLLKRAAALERLGHLDQALECCDRAIVADRTSTMAYLQKGGLYNRMERFEEAIQCYEAALRVRS